MAGRTPSLALNLLAPAGWAFHALARLKEAYYADPGRRVRLPAPCVSVGNLTFGGTGKTPFTAFLARRCRELGFRPAVLLRGYGRRSRAYLEVRPDSTAEEVGDEALVLRANLPEVPVLVGARRERAASLAPAGTDLFLLDDGFQHQRVHRDLDVVLVDATRPEDLAAPPLGRLREPLDALGRGHLLALTRGGVGDLPREVALRWAGRPRVGVRFAWEPLALPDGKPWDSLREQACTAFSGVGHPASFLAQAKGAGLAVTSWTALPDHAAPTPERRNALARACSGSSWVLCTEKDFVKWAPLWGEDLPPLRFPRLQVNLEDPAGALDGLLRALREPLGRIGEAPP